MAQRATPARGRGPVSTPGERNGIDGATMLTHIRSRRRSRAAALSLALTLALTASASGTSEASARGASVRAQIAHSLELAEQDAPLPSPLVNLSSLAGDVWNRHFACFASYEATSVPICPLGDTSASRTVVAMGDSHVGQWLATLDICWGSGVASR